MKTRIYICLLALLAVTTPWAEAKKPVKKTAASEVSSRTTEEATIDRIRAMAGNRPDDAYQQLITWLKPLFDEQQWGDAAQKAEQFRYFFGDYYPYKDLMRVLREPADTTISITSFGTPINTPMGSEYSPTLSGDGKTLYFCGKYRPDNLGNEDIYIAKIQDNRWTMPHVVAGLSTAEGNEAPESVTQDGQVIILFKNGYLYISQKTIRGWSEPQMLPRVINSSSWQADAMMTADGRAILFAAKKVVSGEERESMNIFVSTLQANGQWSEPKSLGRTINTPKNERSPVLHPDMKTLYFCSAGHSTLGGLDVFKSTRKYEDSWTDWTEPVNLGKEINTTGDDCWYKITTDGEAAYFCKQTNLTDGPTTNERGGNFQANNMDLYWVNLPEAMRPEPVMSIFGRVTDRNGKALQTLVVWEDLETNKEVGMAMSDPVDGSYFITLPEGKIYGYYAEKEGYYPTADYADLRDVDTCRHLEKNITLVNIREMKEEGIPIRINNLFFDVDKADLLPLSISELNRAAAWIKQQRVKVVISGHTDSTGTAAHNRELSLRRAEAVRQYLITQGCQADRLTAEGYGPDQPIGDNATPEGRQLNRRVELRIVK